MHSTHKRSSRLAFAVGLLVGLVSLDARVSLRAATAAAPFGLRGTLELDGDSTLHRFSARTTDVRGSVYVDEEALPARGSDVLALVRAGHIKSFDMVAPVEKLSSGDKALDKNMWKALKSSQFKEIRFRAESFQVRPADAQGAQFGLAMKGALTVACVSRPLVLNVHGVGVSGGIRIAGSTSLRMTDYAVKPPVLMLGAIKTADLVVVKFDMELLTTTR